MAESPKTDIFHQFFTETVSFRVELQYFTGAEYTGQKSKSGLKISKLSQPMAFLG